MWSRIFSAYSMDLFGCVVSFLYLLLTFFTSTGKSAKIVKEALLHEELFRDYSPQVRPIMNIHEAVNVRVQVYLLRLIDLSEKDQILRSTIWLQAAWKDELLTWNASEYDDVDMIVAKKKNIWTPDILIVNEVGNKKGISSASAMNDPKVWSNGEVNMWTFKQLKSTCLVDPTKFPFDTQRCFIGIGKWYNPDHKLNITPSSENTNLEFFEKNEEWSLAENHAGTVLDVEEDYGNFTSVYYQLVLKRRPLFNALNLMLPLFVLIVLNQLCFLLPIEGGEKIGFGMSTFLTFVVFLTLISNTMPQSSVHMSIFSIYLVFQLAISALIIALEVVVLHIYYFKSNEQSSPIEWSFCRYVRFLYHKRGKDCDVSIPLKCIDERNYRENNSVSDSNIMTSDNLATSSQDIEQYYHKLAVTMDKVFACVITSINLLAFLVIGALLTS